MAEHSLRLKATLDTKEVQAELQKLRDLQQQVSQNSLLGNSNTQNANLTNLNSTIGKLNSAIGSLQKTIQNLSQNVGRNNNNGNNNDKDNEATHQAALAKQFIRTAVVAYGVNEIGNSFKSYYTNLGDKESLSKANTINYLQEVISGAVSGGIIGSAAGPWGTAAGAFVGASSGMMSAYLQDLANEAKTAAEQLKEFATQIKEARALEKRVNAYLDVTNYNDSVKAKVEAESPDAGLDVDAIARKKIINPQEAEDRASKYAKTAAELRTSQTQIKTDLIEKQTTLQTMPTNWGYTSFEEMQTKLSELQARRAKVPDDSPAAKAADGAIKILQEQIAKYAKAFEDVTTITTKLGTVTQAITTLEAKQAQEIQRAIQLQEQLTKEQQAARSSIRDFNQVVEGKQNKADVARLGSARMEDGIVKQKYNDYLESALSAQADYKTALEDASNAKNSEEYKNAMERATNAKKDWQFNDQQSQMFGNELVQRLQEKLRDLKAPSMTQVNSLASQGFMINKNDDEIRWKQQTDYASQQTQLQKEIRDRLQSMDTSSTFN